ncbi:MAG: Peroxisomal membrane protein PMP27 [Phylliscum demangeonii]|nr:MAG: Peroxisomal membrane protein PMP27 [Phylliscum demangeonii]
MVADALVYHPTVAHYLRFVATTIGRDKLLRTIQYFARFYAWYLVRTKHSAARVAPLEAITKHFGLSRKLLSIGKNVEHLKAAAVAADARGLDPVLQYCTVARQLCYALYLTLDTVTYLDVVGIRRSSAAKRLQRDAYKAWLAGLIFNTVAGVYSLAQLRRRQSVLDRKEGEGVVEGKRLERERMATNLQLVSDLCDITLPSSALGYVNLHDGVVGLAGLVSSVIGVWNVWQKTA